MYRLFEFVRSISLLLLFLFLEGAAILFYAHSNSYTQAKILGVTAHLSDGISGMTGGVGDYFSLREKNELLQDRIMELESELSVLKAMHSDSTLLAHSITSEGEMICVRARVVRNSTNKSKNFILINRGLNSGVRERMAVITPYGEIVGSVVGCTEQYSVVMSLLNSDFRSSGKLKGDSRAGEISWNGESRYTIQLSDLSKYAEPFEGAEIVSTGLSQIFPGGLKIGRVTNYSLSELEGSYLINVDLAADMSALDEVIVLGSVAFSEGRAVIEGYEQSGKVIVEHIPQSDVLNEDGSKNTLE